MVIDLAQNASSAPSAKILHKIIIQVIKKTGMVSSSEEGFERVLDNTEVIVNGSISISIIISIQINIIFNTIIITIIITGKFCIHPRRKRGQVRVLQQLQFYRGKLSFSQFDEEEKNKKHPFHIFTSKIFFTRLVSLLQSNPMLLLSSR